MAHKLTAIEAYLEDTKPVVDQFKLMAETDNTYILLRLSEIMMAAHVGMMRQGMKIRQGIEHKYGGHQNRSWQYHLEGAIGEYVLSKYLNVHWEGAGVARAPDVGGTVDARTTAGDNNRLTIHKEDEDDRQYWLITGLNGRYRVRGWILGCDGKKEKYWEDPTHEKRPAFFIPTKDLNSPESGK